MLDFDPRQCPHCGSLNTHQRSGGPHFENERRCVACGQTWDPEDEQEKYRRAEAERLERNTHRE